ncbi:hypothetical protein ASG73_09555 [Janibacter sp. Soil728]|uniref:hypothetical protein n=1 Tax=Janibacter sp. Soil728 TaxID=1736393 RepID=UPI0006F2B5F2|nr:hypothetical protein [Janibacter sp. Soil728]KRE37858.1 hypothetical protein ASG73_09555 [Janibacter sp. Soil728]
MKAARILVGTIAVVLVVVGVAVAILLGPDDTWGGEPTALPDDAAPIVATAPRLLNVAGLDLVVNATAVEGEAFVGASHPVHVQDYLGGVTRTEITGLSADGIGGSQQLAGERDYPAVPPSRLDVWDQQAQGREAAIEVRLTPDAAVQIAALPATAKGATPQVGVGYKLPGAFVAGVVTALVGLLLLVATMLGGRRARRAAVDRAESVSVEQPATPAGLFRSATRLALVGTVMVLVAGCAVPQEVDHGDSPGVVPLDQTDVQTMLDDYDVRNNAAIKKSRTGDGSLWKSADTGPMLAQDELSARFNAYDKPKGAATSFTHEGGEVYASVQRAYPLWTAVEIKPAKPAKNGVELLYVYEKAHAAGGWKASSSIPFPDGLPTALDAQEATPSSQDLDRAEEVDTMLETWAEKGAVDGLVVDDGMVDARAELHKKTKGVERIADSAESWGGTRGSNDARTATRAVRVKEGLLVLSEIRWTNSQYLKADWTWNPSKREQAVYGNRANGNVSHRRCSLVAATLVPDTGDARVLGSSTDWVL